MITLDFKDDWKAFLEKEMIALGFKYECLECLEENTIRYLNARRRIVSNKPRAIHESKELCIPPEHSERYCDLKHLISEGGDIRPYLSRNVKDANDNDLILNEWGVHHLHFLSSGTKDVLFVMFTDTEAFIIQTLPHGPGHSDVWVNTSLIEILHKNWPEIIAGHKLIGISGEDLTAAQRKNIRKGHGNVAISVSDGTCYSCIGGGIVSSGTCLFDVINCDKLIATLTEWEELVRANESSFRAALKISENDPLSIKLMIEDQGCWLYEPARKTRFQLKYCDNDPLQLIALG
jgi:hypothetical protein